jgi:hypothetical protein
MGHGDEMPWRAGWTAGGQHGHKDIHVRWGGAGDGPFAETKEQIASYIVLECANLAEAIEISSRHPTVRYGGFELRRLAD